MKQAIYFKLSFKHLNCNKSTFWIYGVWKGLHWFFVKKNVGFKWGRKWHLLYHQQNIIHSFVQFGLHSIRIIRTLDNLPQELAFNYMQTHLIWIYRISNEFSVENQNVNKNIKFIILEEKSMPSNLNHWHIKLRDLRCHRDFTWKS